MMCQQGTQLEAPARTSSGGCQGVSTANKVLHFTAPHHTLPAPLYLASCSFAPALSCCSIRRLSRSRRLCPRMRSWGISGRHGIFQAQFGMCQMAHMLGTLRSLPAGLAFGLHGLLTIHE